MGRADTVSLTYTAEIADLKKKLAEIPGATGKEAKKAVAEVSKAVKLVAKAEAEAKKAAEGSAAGLKSLGDAAGKTNESFASMGAALSTVSPELGGMVSRIGASRTGSRAPPTHRS
jgi:membrane protein involved in colicin uptake